MKNLDLLIDAKRLSELLSDPQLLIVDTRSFLEYSEGHIPGSVNMDLFQFHWADTSDIGIRQFQRQARLLLSNIGVTYDKNVVFYDNISGMSAARGVWLLLYFSHRKVSLLDGGYGTWIEEGHPQETKTNPFIPSNFKGKADRKVLASFRDVQKSFRNGGSSIIDARTKEEFDGSHTRAAKRGHIPSATNIDWQLNLDSGRYKNEHELSKIYSGILPDSEVITYCQGGYRAAHTFIALKILGYTNVKMYLGSWAEWGNRRDLPAEQ